MVECDRLYRCIIFGRCKKCFCVMFGSGISGVIGVGDGEEKIVCIGLFC